MRNPYHILGVECTATRAEIQAAFMTQMFAAPDTQADCNWARTQLLDERLRLQWDTQMIMQVAWLERLEPVSTFYAHFDHLAALHTQPDAEEHHATNTDTH